MVDPPDVIIDERDLAPRRGPRGQWIVVAIGLVVLLLVVGRVVFHFAAVITVKSAFYKGIGMGDVYSRRWQTQVVLILVGLGLGVALAVPTFFAWRVPKTKITGVVPPDLPIDPWLARELDRGRLAPVASATRLRGPWLLAWIAVAAIIGIVMASGLSGLRDEILVWRNATSFGDRDPVFGKDIGFYVFSLPVWNAITVLLTAGFVLAALAAIAAGVIRWLGLMAAGRRRTAGRVSARTWSIGLILGGLALVAIGGQYWLSRYGLVIGGDRLVAGAGNATRAIDIPTRTVGAPVVMALGVVIALLGIPPLRRAVTRRTLGEVAVVVVGAWVLVAVVLAIVASTWWLALVVPAAAATAGAVRARSTEQGRVTAPIWVFPIVAVASTIALTLIGPIGAQLNDAVVLRGTRLQVERPNIVATIAATRRATGLDRAEQRDAPYARGAVTRQAIAKAPASVGSLRFLDIPPTAEACSRLQTFNQFYTCDDVDVDRYTLNGTSRTVFSIGREIDYAKLPDFQRRHFSFTHGYGLVLAPVNEIEATTGRPRWIAGGIPQKGLEFGAQGPAIYFGAAASMPWAMVNTSQPTFDAGQNRVVSWKGQSGVRVGSGWRRLAVTEFLGGLPYLGGGRRVWNATSGDPAGPRSDLLLYRDIKARVNEIAPFFEVDEDPYFVAADKRLYVVAPVYATTNRYPYAADFGTRYLRQNAMAVMDAYSGETKLYVLDENEPITRAWRAVHPKLFTPIAQMSPALRSHLRVGERGLRFKVAAAERFHVTDTDVFFNGDEAWVPTEEAYGRGTQGDRIVSPIRYTYAVLPGESVERFVAIQAFKPAVRNRGIGFSGWLAVVNDPDQFGRAVILRFPTNQSEPLDSLDTFTSNVGRDPELSAEIGLRSDRVLRGNTIVVPVGRGLLYVQPLYLDTPGDSLPTLWKVVVSFGDGRVFAGATFAEALGTALGTTDVPSPANPASPSAPQSPGTPPSRTLPQLVRQAGDAFDAYQRALARGDDTEAFRQLRIFRTALAEARRKSGRAAGTP